MSEHKLYIVVGSTGEYSDYTDWNVMAFFDHASATTLRDSLEALAREHGLYEGCDQISYENRMSLPPPVLEADPDAHADYTGITYFLTECRYTPAPPSPTPPIHQER